VAPGYRQGVYRFLLSPRWLRLIAAALAVAAACVALGFWQLDRFDQRRARNDLVKANVAADPVAPGALLAVGRPLPAAQQWRRVEAQGRYDEAHQILVRNRPLEGATGYYVLTPLVTDDGPALLVNRGWVPIGATALARPEVPAAPAGEVTVVARARPSEPADERDAPPQGQVRRIDVPAIAATMPYDVYGGYGDLVEQSPATATSPTALPEPEPGLGPHLAYAFQWFVFAVIALGGVVMLARREARESAPAVVVTVPAPASR
jgi:cytochrome oxidase assembly protein ShyY1